MHNIVRLEIVVSIIRHYSINN